jgi:hypothetical protein
MKSLVDLFIIGAIVHFSMLGLHLVRMTDNEGERHEHDHD